MDIEKLQEENEKLKKQYNCYACGNCRGKEDYVNLEKHHTGLRKQFDKCHTCLQEIEEIVDENKDTAQYGGICRSILQMISKIKQSEIPAKFEWNNPYYQLYLNVRAQRDMWENESNKFKTCLQDIQKIVESYYNECLDIGLSGDPYGLAKKILQKMAEVENG